MGGEDAGGAWGAGEAVNGVVSGVEEGLAEGETDVARCAENEDCGHFESLSGRGEVEKGEKGRWVGLLSEGLYDCWFW